MPSTHSRRDLLALLSAGTGVGLAGCATLSGSESDPESDSTSTEEQSVFAADIDCPELYAPAVEPLDFEAADVPERLHAEYTFETEPAWTKLWEREVAIPAERSEAARSDGPDPEFAATAAFGYRPTRVAFEDALSVDYRRPPAAVVVSRWSYEAEVEKFHAFDLGERWFVGQVEGSDSVAIHRSEVKDWPHPDNDAIHTVTFDAVADSGVLESPLAVSHRGETFDVERFGYAANGVYLATVDGDVATIAGGVWPDGDVVTAVTTGGSIRCAEVDFGIDDGIENALVSELGRFDGESPE